MQAKAGKQAGRQAGRQAGKQADRQPSMHTGMQANISPQQIYENTNMQVQADRHREVERC